jgi:hypothetical protein
VYFGLALVGFGPLGLLGGLALACLRMSAGTCPSGIGCSSRFAGPSPKSRYLFSFLASGKAAVGVLRI